MYIRLPHLNIETGTIKKQKYFTKPVAVLTFSIVKFTKDVLDISKIFFRFSKHNIFSAFDIELKKVHRFIKIIAESSTLYLDFSVFILSNRIIFP